MFDFRIREDAVRFSSVGKELAWHNRSCPSIEELTFRDLQIFLERGAFSTVLLSDGNKKILSKTLTCRCVGNSTESGTESFLYSRISAAHALH
jgi:hypothetical protein